MLNEYRQNVGIVVLKNGLIFSGFRADLPLTCRTGWQMPQGGINEGEEVIQAGYRELYEETGIKKDKVKLVKLLPQTMKYDFTPDVLKMLNERNEKIGYNGKLYKGQEQHWVVFEFIGDNSDINLNAFPEEIDFQKYDWKSADFLVNNVFEMKKDVYRKLFHFMKNDKDFENFFRI